MPAPEIAQAALPQDHAKTLGHVNLMVDTLIANASIDEQVLRAITRTLLATSTPSLAASFTAAARSRLRQTNAKRIASTNRLFATGPDGIHAVPTADLGNVLARVRSLYGAGMGFSSIGQLSRVVSATIGLKWQREGSMADILAVIDADICQAIQSCKEEIVGGRVADLAVARDTISEIWASIEQSSRDVAVWGGEFPFDKTAQSIQYWRI
ncbi:hypothetical protein PAXRUDRAFT_828108 [Paxillus rubicundulus Ve08.2h10]|uniref:Uncharacterized protein n=1 Tax=Paxillus rubicundulus Ve08.2h10 TaxID=930991 RepID=A0A0D0DQ42_9AGAM|nr:hypothetical protein PAXRUDRAFT_828108 [Paxillus rubicundulus Ve08.2h10]